MVIDRNDASWERIAREHPYYGVLSGDEYRGTAPTAEIRDRFFRSGRKHLDRLLPIIAEKFGELPRGTALDFGCGVGRVTLPLAALFDKVIGVDVAPAMLAEAERNCREAGLANVLLQQSRGDLSEAPFDLAFVHSFLVFQHIPRSRGESIFTNLLARLAPGGIAAIQLYVGGRHPARAVYYALRNNLFPIQVIANLWRGRPWNEPVMQMNFYDANRLLEIAAAMGIEDVHLQLGTQGSVTILLRKT
jgi:SAM-dependent methyltransferase